MLDYDTLKHKKRDFLAATGLLPDEFVLLLPAFTQAYQALVPSGLTQQGTPRQRAEGGGAAGKLRRLEDKLLFILVYQKTSPIQTMQALQFGLSQPQANHWIHALLPVLQQALADLNMKPERQASQVATHPLAKEGMPALVLDGTERRRQRPQDALAQREHYSGKKKCHTDKNLLLVNETTNKVVYLGPTETGKKHDKKAADDAQIVYPALTTLDQDTGFQGYAPEQVLVQQPKKSQRVKS